MKSPLFGGAKWSTQLPIWKCETSDYEVKWMVPVWLFLALGLTATFAFLLGCVAIIVLSVGVIV